jgi:DNA-binding response OmpR family regulator
VIQAADGETAYTRAVAEPPDLVLLDAGLEEGQAIELARKLKANADTREAKIVLLTNPHARIDMGEAAQIVDDYLAYPFPPLQLFNTVREHVPEALGEPRWK